MQTFNPHLIYLRLRESWSKTAFVNGRTKDQPVYETHVKYYDHKPRIAILLISTSFCLNFEEFTYLSLPLQSNSNICLSSIPLIAIPLAEIALQISPVNLSIHNDMCPYNQQETSFSDKDFTYIESWYELRIVSFSHWGAIGYMNPLDMSAETLS